MEGWPPVRGKKGGAKPGRSETRPVLPTTCWSQGLPSHGPASSRGRIRLHGGVRCCRRRGYNPITTATKTTCNGPDPVRVVYGKVDRGRRRGLDGEFRSSVVLDDATTNAERHMDLWRILRGRCPRRKAISRGGQRQRQRKTKTKCLNLDS